MRAQQLPDLSETLCVVALLPVGVPEEEPKPRPRLSSSAIALPINASAPEVKSVLQSVSEGKTFQKEEESTHAKKC